MDNINFRELTDNILKDLEPLVKAMYRKLEPLF